MTRIGHDRPDANERLLRLNAALDGELDAMASLAFEREMRDDPALAAEYERLAALRDAIRRHAPVRRRPNRFKTVLPRWSRRSRGRGGRRSVPAPRVVRCARARPRRLARGPRLCRRRGIDVASRALKRRRPNSRLGLRPRSDRRPAVRRRLLRPAHGETLARRRATVSANIVDLAGFPLVGGRIAVVDRIPAPTLVYRHNEHLIAVTELPPDFKGAARAGGIETIDGYHVARWRDANLAYVAVSDADETPLAEFVVAFRHAAGAATEPPA